MNELFYYIDLADRIFNLLNGKINRLATNVILLLSRDIKPYAEIFDRSVIFLNIEKIIQCSPMEKSKKETNLLFVLCHELFHIDQEVINEKYLDDKNYFRNKEIETDYRSLTYILNNLEYLEYTLNITISKLDLISTRNSLMEKSDITNFGDYRRYSIEEMISTMTSYLTRTTNNFWIEKHTVYLWILINDYYEKIPLKINGKYIQESICIIQELIRRYYKAIITNSEVKYFEEENCFSIVINISDSVNGIEIIE